MQIRLLINRHLINIIKTGKLHGWITSATDLLDLILFDCCPVCPVETEQH